MLLRSPRCVVGPHLVIRLARLQSCLNVLGAADRVDEHDRLPAAVFAFEKGVDEAFPLHFPLITIREPFGKYEPRHFAGRFHQTGPYWIGSRTTCLSSSSKRSTGISTFGLISWCPGLFPC